MRKLWLPLGVGALMAALLAGTGFWMLFTTFMVHDDEGYILWSVRQYCEGRLLYTEVYSQYGPFFYAWYRALHALSGLVFDSESARWLTLGYWLIAAGACGAMAVRLTRSWLAGAASTILAFAALQEMIREPFHPGGFLSALSAVGAAVCLVAVQRSAARTFAIAGAAIGTAMALSKINVGAFFLIAAGSWIALNFGGRRWSLASLFLVALGAIGTPLLLMKAHVHDEWVQLFLAVFIASALAMLMNLRAVRRPEFGWSAWGWMAATGAAITGSLAVFYTATGTSLRQLWEAVIVAPLSLPGINLYPIFWHDAAIGCALVGLCLALADLLPQARAPWRPLVLASLRLLGGLAVLLQLTGFGIDEPYHAVFQFGPALAWLMATPLRAGVEDSMARGRSWLAWCALWQTLQAYPVAGSQVSWGCFLFVPLLVAGCYDAATYLGERWPRARVVSGAIGLLLLIAALANWHLASEAFTAYREREPLGLPGTKSLRLSAGLTSEYRVITRNAAAHAGLLFSTPGMLSFNIWAERPTPTAANATVWPYLLDRAQQQAIAQRLVQDKSAMVVARITKGQLYGPPDFLAPFEPVLYVGREVLFVWKGVTIFPHGTARFEKASDGRIFAVVAAAPTQRRIAGLQLQQIEGHQLIAKSVATAEHVWRVTPVDARAQAIGETRNEAQPFVLPGVSFVQVALDPAPDAFNLDAVEAALTTSDGSVVETYRFNKMPIGNVFAPR